MVSFRRLCLIYCIYKAHHSHCQYSSIRKTHRCRNWALRMLLKGAETRPKSMEGFNDFQEIAGHTFRLGEMENAVLLICVFICFYTHAYQKIRKFWAFNGSQPIFCWRFSRRIP